jgi:hypothetical protein
LGYTISDSLNLTVGYKSTRHDTAPDGKQGSGLDLGAMVVLYA